MSVTPPSPVAVLPPARCSRLTKAKALNFTICSLCPFIFFFFLYLFFLTFVNTQLPLHLACDDCAVVAAARSCCLFKHLFIVPCCCFNCSHTRAFAKFNFILLFSLSVSHCTQAEKQARRHAGRQALSDTKYTCTHTLGEGDNDNWQRDREWESGKKRHNRPLDVQMADCASA